MGFLETVFVILLVLKLAGVVAISWLAVFSPLLLALAVYVVWVLILVGIVLVKH